MTTEPKAEGGCTDVEVLRDILGDHPLPSRQREAVESAIRSLIEHAEHAEGGEAVHPRSIDSLALELSRFPMAAIVRALDKAVPGFAASYLRPAEVTSPAVEALAKAAKVALDEPAMLPADWVSLKNALAHPEIAALLKGETK